MIEINKQLIPKIIVSLILYIILMASMHIGMMKGKAYMEKIYGKKEFVNRKLEIPNLLYPLKKYSNYIKELVREKDKRLGKGLLDNNSTDIKYIKDSYDNEVINEHQSNDRILYTIANRNNHNRSLLQKHILKENDKNISNIDDNINDGKNTYDINKDNTNNKNVTGIDNINNTYDKNKNNTDNRNIIDIIDNN
ncbi:hypothetical protein SLOPH_826, partial [Spraguea lophii 42_110]